MNATGTQPTPEITATGSQDKQTAAHTRWTDLVFVLFIAFSGSILTAVYALFNPGYVATPNRYPGLSTAYLLLHTGIDFAALLYVLSKQGRSIRSLGLGFRWGDPIRAIGVMILAAFALALVHFIVRGLGQLFGVMPDLRHVADVGWKEHSISELIHDIASPIDEEVLVRGYLMTEMIELGKPVGLAVLASVVLQASYHLYYGLGTAVSLSGSFLVLALYFSWSRRLMPVLLAHLLWDVLIYFRH
jgi:membrane protease YdiL (CAAX protease family)